MDDVFDFEFFVFGVGEFHLRLRLLPFLVGDLFRFMEEHEGAFLIADDDFRKVVAIDIFDADLSADTGIVIDQVRDPID